MKNLSDVLKAMAYTCLLTQAYNAKILSRHFRNIVDNFKPEYIRKNLKS